MLNINISLQLSSMDSLPGFFWYLGNRDSGGHFGFQVRCAIWREILYHLTIFLLLFSLIESTLYTAATALYSICFLLAWLSISSSCWSHRLCPLFASVLIYLLVAHIGLPWWVRACKAHLFTKDLGETCIICLWSFAHECLNKLVPHHYCRNWFRGCHPTKVPPFFAVYYSTPLVFETCETLCLFSALFRLVNLRQFSSVHP